MKSTIAASFALLTLTSAIALPQTEAPKRVLPPSWKFEITSLKGPGCPDFDNRPEDSYSTRTTFGQNTVDGSEIYYWFVAYPALRVKLGGEEHSWCETELSYQELKGNGLMEPAYDYRLRLHKNGTQTISTYELDEGVKATFKFAYDTGRGDDLTDTVTIAGPAASGQYAKTSYSDSKKSVLYKEPKCGVAKIKFRTDLTITGKDGKKGFVASEEVTGKDGKKHTYGTQQGFSYDFEKCDK